MAVGQLLVFDRVCLLHVVARTEHPSSRVTSGHVVGSVGGRDGDDRGERTVAETRCRVLVAF